MDVEYGELVYDEFELRSFREKSRNDREFNVEKEKTQALQSLLESYKPLLNSHEKVRQVVISMIIEKCDYPLYKDSLSDHVFKDINDNTCIIDRDEFIHSSLNTLDPENYEIESRSIYQILSDMLPIERDYVIYTVYDTQRTYFTIGITKRLTLTKQCSTSSSWCCCCCNLFKGYRVNNDEFM